MFRNSLKGARDMYCVESSDSGKTWGEAWKLGTGTWELPACPMDGGGLAYLTDGTLFAAWRRKNQVYESRGQSEERSQGEGTQPWVGGVPGGKCWTAWEDSEGGVATRCQADSVSVAFKIGAKCSDPVVDGSASGTVFCAWEVVHKDGTPPAVYGAFLARPVAPK
jgi:hypothetical protein